MNRVLIAAVILLGVGLWLIFYFCHGNVGFGVGFPVSGTNLHMDVTTMGVPALVGVPMVVIGALLLVIAFIGAIAAQFSEKTRAESEADLPARRDEPFSE